jgi:hypothetical protein
MQHTAQASPKTAPEHQRAPLVTTVYELIEAIDEELQPGEEELLAEVFCHMANRGKIGLIHKTDKQSARKLMGLEFRFGYPNFEEIQKEVQLWITE